MRFVWCWGLLLCAVLAQAAPRMVFQGVLEGAGEVVMELRADPKATGVYQGRYFYKRYGVDIPLRGKPGDLLEAAAYFDLPESAREERGEPSFEFPAAHWRGRLDVAAYQGEWQAGKGGKRRAFRLRKVAEYDPDAAQEGPDLSSSYGGQMLALARNKPVNMQDQPYDTLKMQGHAQPIGPTVGNAEVAYRMWRDPRTKFSYPRLARHPNAAVMARINQLLEQNQWEMSLAALDCVADKFNNGGPASGGLAGFDEERFDVIWLSTALMQIRSTGSLFCNGAHPNNHYDLETFDLRQGGALDWARLLKGYPLSDEDAASAALERYIQRLVAREQKHRKGDECMDVLPEYMAFELSAPGRLSFVISGIGHAMGACLGDGVDTSFAKLGPYLKPAAKRYLIPSILPKS